MAPTLALVAQYEPRQHYRQAVRRKHLDPTLQAVQLGCVRAE